MNKHYLLSNEDATWSAYFTAENDEQANTLAKEFMDDAVAKSKKGSDLNFNIPPLGEYTVIEVNENGEPVN